MSLPNEAAVQINGAPLTVGEALTIRVAVTQFLMDLQANGLGDDDMGKALCRGYQQACEIILAKMTGPRE